MHDIYLNTFAKVRTNRRRVRVSRIGGSHYFPIPGDGVVSFEYLDDHRAGCHVTDKVIEERAPRMHSLEALCLFAREVPHSCSDELQP